MKSMKEIIKTLFLNFYYFPIKTAIHLPIKCNGNVRIASLGSRDSVTLLNPNARIAIGYNGAFCLGYDRPTYWHIGKNGQIIFAGKAYISRGTQLIADGRLEFGKDFYCNSNCIINSGKRISFGDDCLLGWNVTILDGDGHVIEHGGGGEEKSIKPMYFEIAIGKHVWIASETTILKGAEIGIECVVACRSCISKKHTEKKVVLFKYDEVAAKNIEWKK